MRRGKERWTQADDERLGRALLAVYEAQGEAVVTSDGSELWTRVQQRYQAFTTAEKTVKDISAATRSARSLHTRWARDIRPEMTLYASIVDRLLQAGWKSAQAYREASRRFQSKRTQVNAEIMRQFAQDRKRAGSNAAPTEPQHPRLKFESFHYRHCYDILRSEPRFLESLLTQKSGEDGSRKRRRSQDEEDTYLSSGDSDSPSPEDGEDEQVESTTEMTPAPARPLKRKTSAISRESLSVSDQGSPRQGERAPVDTSGVANRQAATTLVNGGGSSSKRLQSRLECNPAIINSDSGQRMHAVCQDQRLKLLAELRAVVATIAKLTQQLTWNGVASAALKARMGGRSRQLDEDVLRDIALFRQEKRRLKQQLAEIDGSLVNAG